MKKSWCNVVTPDATPQTQFEPASVTFTETGGMVNGVATQRWDAPATIEVRPVNDNVDERRGNRDFTAFSINRAMKGRLDTAPHEHTVNPSDAATGGSTCASDTALGCAPIGLHMRAGLYNPGLQRSMPDGVRGRWFAFATYPSTGSAHAWGDLSSFRAEDHTPYGTQSAQSIPTTMTSLASQLNNPQHLELTWTWLRTGGRAARLIVCSRGDRGSTFGYYTMSWTPSLL